MAKNEAKIKFTAETGEFNNEIKKANNEMSELRAEMKNAEAQMQNTGDEVEFLTKKHDLLEKQLKASQSKTEALNSKLEKARKIFGDNSDEASKLKVQLTNAKTAEEKLQKQINDCTDELKDHAKHSKEARKALKDMGESAKNTEGGFTVAKGAIADLASNAIQAAISKVGEFVGALMELPEATREIRQDMATLDTSFEKAGLTNEQATKTWRDLYGVFGEDDRAVEASNLIAKMSKNQEDLNSWVTITKGVWGTYQDSLPVEGLAEASNETAKTGKVTGNLADALNWGAKEGEKFGVKLKSNTKANEDWNKAVKEAKTAEDYFNLALQQCGSEQERQALITDTLTNLYGDAATEYEKASGAQIEAKETTADNILAQNNLADAIEPLTTEWQTLKTEMAQGFLPAAEKISGWGVSALNWMKEHPTTMKVIIAVLGTFAVALGALAIGWGVYTAAQWLANSALWAFLAPILPIVAAIALVVAGIVILWNECEGFRNFVTNAWEKIKAVWAQAKPYFEALWSAIKTYFSIAVDFIVAYFKATWENIKLVWSVAVDYFKTIWNNIKLVFSVVKKVLSGDFRGAWEDIKQIWSNCTGFFSRTIEKVKNTFSKIKDIIVKPFKSAIDKIKGFFDNLKLKFPKIKLPHFSISGKFSLSPPSVPKLKIDWYKDGGIFTKPTIFNTPYGLKGVGEAGAEAVLPIDRLQNYITGAIEKTVQTVNLQSLADSIEDLANRPNKFYINGKEFALATAGDTDSVSGVRSTLKTRGLALD